MSGDPWRTALGLQARAIHDQTKSVGRTAAELVRKGATDDEIRDLFYPGLKATERRLLDRTLEDARMDLFGLEPGDQFKPESLLWLRFRKAYREAKRAAGTAPTPDQTARAFGTSYETMRVHLKDELGLNWRAAVARAEAQID